LIIEPESGLGEVRCPGLTAETSSDASGEMRVSVPRTCLSELEPGPFRLELRLYTPVEGGGLDDSWSSGFDSLVKTSGLYGDLRF